MKPGIFRIITAFILFGGAFLMFPDLNADDPGGKSNHALQWYSVSSGAQVALDGNRAAATIVGQTASAKMSSDSTDILPGFWQNFGPMFICGDANSDNSVNVSDAVYIINYVFSAGSPEPNPLVSADVNCDQGVNISDAVWIINFVFVNGYAPCDINGDSIIDC